MKNHRYLYKVTLAAIFSLLVVPLSGQNLISWYTLNGNAEDQGSLGADGTLSGSASYINEGPGVYNQALSTLGSGSNFMTAPTGGSYEGLEQITVAMWVNLQGNLSGQGDRLLSTMSSGVQGFDLRFQNNGTADNFQLMWSVNATSGPTSQGVSSSSSNGISADDQWAFVAVTYDSSNGQVRFYLGNETESVVAIGTGTHNNGAIGLGNNLRIGSTPATSNDRTPPAYFSDVRIYDGVLDINQLEEIRGIAVIPEPAHFAALFGLLALAFLMWRKRGRV